MADAQCEFTFGNPTFEPIIDDETTDTSHTIYKGYKLIFKSDIPYKKTDSGNIYFTYEISTECINTVPLDNIEIDFANSNAWTYKINYKSKGICATDYHNFMAPLNMLYGAFMIVFGIFFISYGSRFYDESFAAIVGICVFLTMMTLSYNSSFFFNEKYEVDIPLLILVIILAVIIAGIVAWYLKKFAFRFGPSLMCALSGFAIMNMFLSFVSVNYKYRIVLVILTAVICGYFGRDFKDDVRVVGTSIIGGFFTMYGLG